MNKYEVMVIVKPAEEETTNAVIEKVEALIARVGGTVEKGRSLGQASSCLRSEKIH